MHVNTKKLTVSSLLLAVAILFIYLGNVLETSTVFFLALASFCPGIVRREYGNRAGFVYLTATFLLGLILIPQKLYMLTFFLFSLYILLSELIWEGLCRLPGDKNRERLYLIFRLLLFNILYLPLAFLQPGLVWSKEVLARMGTWLYPLLFIAGQVFWILFDRAYGYFQGRIWERIRKQIER